MADKMTRYQFALSEKNVDVLRYLAAEQEVSTSIMLRMVLRDLYNIHKTKVVAWKVTNGQPVSMSQDEEVGYLVGDEGVS